MEINFKYVYLLFPVIFLLATTVKEARCDERGMSMAEIRYEVAEAMRTDALLFLRKQMLQEEERSQRSQRSRQRNTIPPSLYHPNFRARFGERRLSNNNVAYKRNSNFDVTSALRKYWRHHRAPYFSRRNFPIIDINVPSVTRTGQLLNRLGKIVAVSTSGVTGENLLSAANTRLQMESVGFGVLMIKGLDSNQYICMNNKTGNVYVSSNKSLECVFMERHELNRYYTYQAFLHRSHKTKWYLSLNGEGKPINGRRSKYYKKSSQFMRI